MTCFQIIAKLSLYQGGINCGIGSQIFIFFGSQRVNDIFATKSTEYFYYLIFRVKILSGSLAQKNPFSSLSRPALYH